MKHTIEELISKEGVASSLPNVYYDLKEAIDDVDSEFEDFEYIIMQDISLSARLLKIVNSPFFGLPSQVETVSHAIGIIGLTELNELVLSTFVLDKFKAIPSKLFDINRFADHSVFCGTAARLIAEMIRYPKRETLFTSGMLHDIGRLVLCVNASETMLECFKLCEQQDDKTLAEIELEVLGFDHSEVGMALLKSLKLPQVHIETAGHHHKYSDSLDFALETAILHVSDLLAWQNGKGEIDISSDTPSLNESAWKKLEFTDDITIETLQETVEDKLSLANQSLI